MSDELECLGETIAELAAHLDAATHRLLTALREFDARGGWRTQGAVSCAHWLAWRVGWDLVTARDRVRVARKLADFPAIDDALRRGQLSYSKVRALLRIATPANEAMIIDQARLTTASQLEILVRKYALVQRHGQDQRPQDDEQRRYVLRRDTEDGMVKIEAVLHPEEAELVWAMLDHAAKHVSRGAPSQPGSKRGSAEPSTDLRPAEPAPASPGAPHLPSRRRPSAANIVMGGPTEPTAIPQPDHALVTAIADSAQAPAIFRPDHGVANAADTATGDSSEAPAVPRPGGSRTSPLAAATTDSAEAYLLLPRSEIAEESVVRSPVHRAPAAGRAANDASSRSLFDRLIDEVEAAEIARAEQAPLFSEVTGAGSDFDHEAAPIASATSSVSASVPDVAAQPGARRLQADAARRAFDRADALVSVAQAYLRGDRPQRMPIDVTVTIPASSLRKGAVDTIDIGCMAGACISAETARRLSCDSGVIEVIEDDQGVPLSVGRKRRAIAGSIKRALLRRDTSCCYPGCANRTFLEGHHIEHWADGGETTLDNGALLCSHHHRFVHEYGYTIELGAERRPQFRDPSGRIVATVPAQRTDVDLGWPRIHAMNEPLGIDATTIACEWDGSRANYSRLVSELITVDGLS